AQAAIVIMTHDGAVKAMVGGREKGAAQFNRATQALRQTGSAFKAVVYAAGLEAGMRPNDQMQDAPITIRGWSPKNYGDRYRGPITLEEALAASVNTVAVRVSERAGRSDVRALAQKMGLTTPLAPGPAVALGTSEARLIEMTGLFATIANGGRAVTPYGVGEIRLRGDQVPIDRGPSGTGDQVISTETAGLLTYMLKSVIDEGTGKRATLADRQAAGKTGTTQKARDAWFIGYTADYVAGVWMGYDDNRPLTGVTGGGLPADIWREVMTRIHQGKEAKPLNLIRPAKPEIVLAPTVPSDDRAPAAPAPQPSGGTLVEQIFRDVVDGLSDSGDSNRFENEAGNDR
ncbi:MAG: penicillin-binding transpeptidase domain-containing protein, partial [Pseudomonadota bacterium]